MAERRREVPSIYANDSLLAFIDGPPLHNGKVVGKKKMRPSVGAPLYILDIKDVKT